MSSLPTPRDDKALGDGFALGQANETLQGLLHGYPGAVALIGRNNVVLSANGDAQPLIEALRSGQHPALIEAIFGGFAGQICEVAPLILAGQAGGSGTVYDVMVLPWSRNTTCLLLARDASLDHWQREAVRRGKAQAEAALALAADLAWRCDKQGRFLWLQPDPSLFGPNRDLLGQPAGQFVALAGAKPGPYDPTVSLTRCDAELRGPEERRLPVILTNQPQFDETGAFAGCTAVAWAGAA